MSTIIVNLERVKTLAASNIHTLRNGRAFAVPTNTTSPAMVSAGVDPMSVLHSFLLFLLVAHFATQASSVRA